MSSHESESIYQALASIRLVDPHSHINPHDPASHTLADLLGYHYYTELAHSSGMPKAHIEDRSIGPKELVSRLVQGLPAIENTVQYRWLVELCRKFYGFDGDRIDASNWESLYDAAEARMQAADWPQMVLEQSNVEAVFLTNDFDDKLEGFDTDIYIPCLRTDELVFHLHKRAVQQRLEAATGVELDGSLASLRQALTRRFEHFVLHGARACAISLPPGFTPTQVSDGRASSALDDVLTRNEQADAANRDALSRRVFWTLAELCDEFGLPFDLMIGVNRGVYAGGVYQGQDLYDSRVSLIQYRELFNAFPDVKFPISVLASVTNQELVSYAWIFPNVITNGHWWYSNTPSFIARDAVVRLEAVPQTKQIAYYSDAYKLEFIWPKFDMYRRILADLLADQFVRRNGWSEERAIDLGRKILRDNVDEIFHRPDTSKIHAKTTAAHDELTIATNDSASTVPGVAGAAAGLAATAAAFGAEIDDVELADDVEPFDDAEFDEHATLGDTSAAMSHGGVENWDEDESGSLEQTVDESHGFETVVEHADEMTSDTEDVAGEPSERGNSDIEDTHAFTTDLETIEESTDEETLPSDNDYFDEMLADVESSANYETIDGQIENDGDRDEPASDQTLELDSVPSDDEIRSLPLADVELRDAAADGMNFDADKFAGEIDDEPLDLGELFGEDAKDDGQDDPSTADPSTADKSDDFAGPQIRMLRGEESFSPDEDSLQVNANPSTGELVFPVDDDEAAEIAKAINPNDGKHMDVAEFSNEVALDDLFDTDDFLLDPVPKDPEPVEPISDDEEKL